MIFRDDRRPATTTNTVLFDVIHFQVGCLGNQTCENLAKLFAVLSGNMLASAREVANNAIFLAWLDGPHLIVDFAVTIKIGRITMPRSMLARQPLLEAAYHLLLTLTVTTASGFRRTAIRRKMDCAQPISSRV